MDYVASHGECIDSYLVLGPDCFEGDPIYKHQCAEAEFDRLKWITDKRKRATELVAKLVKAAKDKYDTFFGLVYNILNGLVHRCVTNVGAEGIQYTAVGYCFGAPDVVSLLASDWLAAGVIAPPTFLTEDDLHKVKKPLRLPCAGRSFFSVGRSSQDKACLQKSTFSRALNTDSRNAVIQGHARANLSAILGDSAPFFQARHVHVLGDAYKQTETMAAAARFAKEKGNIAYKTKDYVSARDHYTNAIRLDPSEYTYSLNRSMANVKLEKWCEAEQDATTALTLAPGNSKAYFWRNVARREQGNLLGSLKDITAHADAGGSFEIVLDEISKIVAAGKLSTTPTTHEPELQDTPVAVDGGPKSSGFVIAESERKGMGAFAIQVFHRGDLVLAERPLYMVDNPDDGMKHQANVEVAVRNLSETELKEFLSLRNAHTRTQRFYGNAIVGTHSTNAFAASDNGREKSVLCVRASRFNHSCVPNATYSWHASSGQLRIYALRDVAVGEELFVTYIRGRNVYGSPREVRQSRLKTYGFTCACPACTLPEAEQVISDRRRMEIKEIWESVPRYGPNRTADRLRAIVRAMHLLQEEGYAADADDFTNDAAGICACHSDWDSVDYWAKKTYETRVAEYGEDGRWAVDAQSLHLQLRKHPQAGTQRKEIFTIRL
ncbi:hypothetical protein EW146_g1123 [Bondarzewia mesenterica]|uniref:SET domain-containing protein n=1 Tax=Bondarzewia mesenterica TaxID=1095465 RepID=A0A4S4MB39_9AGAM|nr:hypothetical protein EW146_g1123 [Bondarzewia mesenterica]